MAHMGASSGFNSSAKPCLAVSPFALAVMAATAPSAAQIAALVAVVKQLFATSFIGFSIATTLYGISCLQAYLYYRNYPKDHLLLKSTVALLWVLDTLCTIFVAHSLYTYFVLNFGKNPTVDLVIPWSFTTEKFLVTLITFVAQLFYARTIWKSSENWIITGSVTVIAVVTFALGIVTTVHLYQTPLATSISARSFQILSGLVQGFAAFNDVLITVCLCFWLYQQKRGAVGGRAFGTDQILDTLILYAVSRGILTAITQFLFLTLNLALPHATYWMPFHQAVGKLYVNSVYATLNVRSTFSNVDNKQSTNLSFADVPGINTTTSATGVTSSNTASVPSDKRAKPVVLPTTHESIERSHSALEEKEAGDDV
ncbi:hypothetical protein R3P38DRAFT_3261724 [Favolaschia claudopus]|uniref:DUF6534 domain-containing protein n=1 Tax=Favolaschia claudopus TaxID=2862362 RepID=A0AAW0CJE1_9AGAR